VSPAHRRPSGFRHSDTITMRHIKTPAGKDLIMKRTSSVDEEQILDFVYVSSNIQFVTKSTPSIQRGKVNSHEVNESSFKPVFL